MFRGRFTWGYKYVGGVADYESTGFNRKRDGHPLTIESSQTKEYIVTTC
jgi:hypothetical protein